MQSPKGLTGVMPVARSRLSIVVTVGGLAVFLVVASFLMTSYPTNSSFQVYSQEEAHVGPSVSASENHTVVVVSERDLSVSGNEDVVIKGLLSKSEEERHSATGTELSSDVKEQGGSVSRDTTKEAGIDNDMLPGLKNDSGQSQPDIPSDDGSPPSDAKGPELERDSGKSTSDGENVSMTDGLVSSNSNAVKETEKLCPSSSNDASGKCSPEIHNGEEGASDAEMVAHEAEKETRVTDGSLPQNSSKVMGIDETLSPGIRNDSQKASSEIHNEEAAPSDVVTVVPSPPSDSRNENGKAQTLSCDLYQGKWIYDSAGPLYTNNTCPFITQMQNCQGNGRPDKDYENYRWKPDYCDLPRFNPRKFLELMRGKTLAYIGDSVARNQMESMFCILWQEEIPKNRGNRRMQRWIFKSTSTTIIRIWSSWLVHQDAEPFQFAPKGITKVFLDVPDETFMELLPTFDVVVLSSGHWFAKQSAYILNNSIVGGQLWWPKDAGAMKINNVEAFGISVETTMTAIANNPNFTGLAIIRSYSPDHYEGGAWNTGGSCTGKVKPVTEVLRNGFTDVMHEKQIAGFQRAVEKSQNGSAKLKLMDITEVFAYRADGHPGPFRSPDPNKLTKRGPHGEPPPQDCLHWCMPGPVDIWNEMLLEVIRREFEGA